RRSVCCVPGPEPSIPGEGAGFAAVPRGNPVVLGGSLIDGQASQGEITAVGPGGRDESGKLIPIDPQARRSPGDLPVGRRWRCRIRALLSSPSGKNNSVFPKCKSGVHLAPSRLDQEGRLAIVTKREAGCGGRGRRF